MNNTFFFLSFITEVTEKHGNRWYMQSLFSLMTQDELMEEINTKQHFNTILGGHYEQ